MGRPATYGSVSCEAKPAWSSSQPVNKGMDNKSTKEREVSCMWKIRKGFLEEVLFKLCVMEGFSYTHAGMMVRGIQPKEMGCFWHQWPKSINWSQSCVVWSVYVALPWPLCGTPSHIYLFLCLILPPTPPRFAQLTHFHMSAWASLPITYPPSPSQPQMSITWNEMSLSTSGQICDHTYHVCFEQFFYLVPLKIVAPPPRGKAALTLYTTNSPGINTVRDT